MGNRASRPRLECMVYSDKISSFSAWLGGYMEDLGRDASHGMEHFERVRQMAVALYEESKPGGGPADPEELLILELAALCHDVLDHKYIGSPKELQAARAYLMGALDDVAELTSQQRDRVLLVADNISLSKEKARQLQMEELRREGLVLVRDCVSDADKLDALGRLGLRRLAQYQLCHSGADSLTPAYLRDVSLKHLLPRVLYLRTEAGVKRGRPALEELEDALSDDASLWAVIGEVFVQNGLAVPVARFSAMGEDI